jgi:hypothetical protein
MEMKADTSRTLRQKRDELYKAAREHPGSEEDEMVEILLLSAMSNIQPAHYDSQPRLALGDERRRFHAAHERRVRERRAQRRAPERGGEGTEAVCVGETVAELRREVEKRQRQLERVEEALKTAQAAVAAGKQVTDMEIYNRIAAVVGLRSPLQPASPADESEG